MARSNLDWGFEIKVDNPAEVGADRLLNTLAAHQAHHGPLVILDFGTATTFDVVKTPHHGSANLDDGLMAAVRAPIAVISVTIRQNGHIETVEYDKWICMTMF